MAGIFKAYDIRGIYGEQLNEEMAYMIGLAMTKTIYKPSDTIIVGYDMRTHSRPLKISLIQGIRDGGCNAIDMGLCATPMNYWAISHYNAQGGVMITASHNGAEYNGMKMSREQARPVAYQDGICLIEQWVDEHQNHDLKPYIYEQIGNLKILDQKEVLSEYIQWMQTFMPDNQKPLRIAVDTANGMGGLFVEPFFALYEHIELIPLYWELDGSFPNHEADPHKPANLKDLQKAVLENKCDFGIGFDGDADRAVFVDDRGKIIFSDMITAYIAPKYLTKYPQCKIGYDLRSSRIVQEKVEEMNGIAIRTKVGHSNIKQMMRAEDIKFAGELSGHYYFADCFYADSALMALIDMIEIWYNRSSRLSQAISEYHKYFSSGEISYQVQDVKQVLDKIEKQYQAKYHIDYLDGVSIIADDWRFNLRASNTEPLLRLNLEASTDTMMKEKLAEIQALLN